MTLFSDTIFALATPLAKSGVAIIRISGKLALPTLIQLTGKTSWQPNLATYCTFFSPMPNAQSPIQIDTGLALYFAAPKSFTGEDVVELHLHGSLAVIREMQTVLSEIPGLRHAEAGEFTRRAFMNGKMDLLEAEGLADLIEAETLQQKRQSQAQMQGEMSRYYESLRTQMVRALAHLEAYIDFPEEEIPESVIISLKDDIHQMVNNITAALDDGRRGERLREGLTIAIIGAPNAGKSSILNRLAGRDAAIVSPLAGTTRDVIEIHKEIAGFPVTFLDTAGLRDAADSIEEEGVRRARQRAAGADLKLIVFDAGQPMDSESRGQIDANSLIILNKIDCHPGKFCSSKIYPGSSKAKSQETFGVETINISALTGEGMDVLMASITMFIQQKYHTSESILITRARHRELLETAKAHLLRIQLDAPLELTCEELRRGAVCLGKITGKISVDDVLDVVFSTFCIGK
ncbi:MAG: tRNA uridine-5-carboxymethylaminomethyl(34) synthesis GTPase MnmE [Alphaproteobacteria bacterium]|nr:tRNA uridine-5-carboxymethylaminomethyl(34) synthesis GTPase MnmE [Alphaproteobacteria bacterium]